MAVAIQLTAKGGTGQSGEGAAQKDAAEEVGYLGFRFST